MISQSDGFDLNLKFKLPEARKYSFVVICLLACIAVAYGNSLKGQWIFDDEPHILINRYVHITTLDWNTIVESAYGIDQKALIRPVAYISFALNYYFGQLNVTGYHIVNLIILYVSGIFLFLFVFRTLNLPRLKTRYGTTAYEVALLNVFFWTVNPMQVTAVTYIVQRMASMAGMFYIMGMYFYLVARTAPTARKKIALYTMTFSSFILAVGSKENAVMLPVSLYFFDLVLIQGASKTNILKGIKYFLVPAGIAITVTFLFFIDLASLLKVDDYTVRPFTMWQRLLTESRVILFYASLLLYPTYSRLMLNHDFTVSTSLIDPWTTPAAILIIAGCLVLVVWQARKNPLISFSILFFFLNHLIEGTIIPLELVFEHTNYTPSMLFFLPVSLLTLRVLDFFSRRPAIQISIALTVSFLFASQGHTVYMYNYLFKDPYILWSDNIAKAPNLSRPYNNLGNILWNRGFHEEAFKAYETSYRLNNHQVLPLISAPLNNMGRYYFYKGDYAAAMEHFEESKRINPRYPLTWINIARTQIRLNDLGSAEETVIKGINQWPGNAWLNALSSFIHLKKGRYQSSIKAGLKTLQIDPDSTDVARVLGEAYRKTGNVTRALSYWESYAVQYPQESEGYLALIELYTGLGLEREASRAIAQLFMLKGLKDWRTFLDEYGSKASSNAFEPDRKRLLRIIRKNVSAGL
jgi:tetratricopeptide (TPR) repeat protein